MGKIVVLTVIGLAMIAALALVYGSARWRSATSEIHATLEAARRPIEVKTYSPHELIALPAPVQRYFRTVLTEGQPMVAAVIMDQSGIFNTSETGEQWRPFISTQRVVTQRPGFDWEARIRMAPGLTVKVHDAYIAGEGMLHASLFGLVSLSNLRGTPEVAQGELMRFLAEAAWYPTALLPSQGVKWEAADGTSAWATLKDGDTTVKMLFRFNEKGLIESVRAEARGRTVAGTVIPTPWEGRWSNYEIHDGMLIPLDGEVAWILPEGPKPYWRGRIKNITYEWVK